VLLHLAFVSKDSVGDTLTFTTLLCEIDKEHRKDLSASFPTRSKPRLGKILYPSHLIVEEINLFT
jgi:hypothetical protein